MKTNCVFFITHRFSPFIEKNFLNIKECFHEKDVYIATNNPDKIPAKYKNYLFVFDIKKMTSCWEDGKDLYMSDFHNLPLLIKNSWFRYTYYWFIEYDVHYTGNWDDIFLSTKNDNSDLIGALIYKYTSASQEKWWHWGKCKIKDLHKWCEEIRGFLPIYRISYKGIGMLKKACDLWESGFYEVFIPTIINKYGGSISQLSWKWPYVPKARENIFYKSYPGYFNHLGEFRWRPGHIFLKNDRLYHPIKDNVNIRDYRFFLLTFYEYVKYVLKIL